MIRKKMTKKDDKKKDGLEGAPLGAEEIKFMQNYGRAAYAATIKTLEKGLKSRLEDINKASGIQESDKGLAHPSQWDMASDQQRLSQEQPLKVARCTRIIQGE